MTRTEFLREQTITSKNKTGRRVIPKDWSTAKLECSLPERKALGLKMMLENMPLFIGEKELIVGTRTLYGGVEGNEDNHDVSEYKLFAYPSYVNEKDTQHFGFNEEFMNKTHATPDYAIILELGIGGIIANARKKLKQKDLSQDNIDFLNSVIIAYEGLSILIKRYRDYAKKLAQVENNLNRKKELLKIITVCENISLKPPCGFYEAVQLFWFAQLTTIIESIQFINYGRVDVFLNPYLGNMDRENAQQIIDCVLLKMYDQVDIHESYLSDYAAQLNITIGGVLRNGEDAVNEVTYMFIEGIKEVALPEPEVSIRVNSKNPLEFLERCCKLSVKGYNYFAYYNDDLFIESMVKAGVSIEDARDYSFDLCQDMTFAGKGDLYVAGATSIAFELMNFLEKSIDYTTFEELLNSFKEHLKQNIYNNINAYLEVEKAFSEYKRGNKKYYFDRVKTKVIRPNLQGKSLMSPLPFLSGLYHNCIESATDFTLDGYLLQHKGYIIGCPTEGINSLAAIKKMVFDDEKYNLKEVYKACKVDYEGYQVMCQELWNVPKWGNDEDYVDLIGKEVIEFCCKEIIKFDTYSGGKFLAGVHQPHPVATGEQLCATPEGRRNKAPVAVTLTPESGTMKNGPTATLKSASKIDPDVCQWNFCVMINYYASNFEGNDGHKIFMNLLKSYFNRGGLQHQPNVLNPEQLRDAQVNPEKYKDLTVRLWGVSAHFIDLPKELQEEVINRLS